MGENLSRDNPPILSGTRGICLSINQVDSYRLRVLYIDTHVKVARRCLKPIKIIHFP